MVTANVCKVTVYTECRFKLGSTNLWKYKYVCECSMAQRLHFREAGNGSDGGGGAGGGLSVRNSGSEGGTPQWRRWWL